MQLRLISIRSYYAAYFAAMGLIIPFFPLWLQHQQVGVATIGMLTGLLAAGKIVAPPLAGWLADRHPPGGLRMMIVVALSLAALFALAWLVIVPLWLLALAIFLFGMLWAATLPLADHLSIVVSEARRGSYGRLRAFGSMGFVVTSFGGGFLMVGDGVALLPWWIALLVLLAGLSGLGFPAQSLPHSSAHGRHRPNHRLLRALIVAGLLMQMSHGAYYGFFSIYLSGLGYSSWQIGIYWVIGVLAEVVLMWRLSDRLHAASPRWVLSICLLLAAVRWIGTASAEQWWLIALLQLLHAASYAAFHVTALVWVQRWSQPGGSAVAQGWFSSAGFGLGTSLGVMGCGWLISQAGFTAAWWLCAAIALSALWMVRMMPARAD
ncbi:MAG: MFS transporter [Mariprofundales bacterium]